MTLRQVGVLEIRHRLGSGHGSLDIVASARLSDSLEE